jgi:hypothetical protein
MVRQQDDNKTMFTERQLQWLEQQFPALVLSPETPEAKLRQYFGQQSVVQAVRSRVQRG